MTDSLREIFWTSDWRVGQGIATLAELDYDILRGKETMGEVAASQTAMDEVTASQTAMDILSASELAMGDIADSETGMNSVLSSELAFQTVIDAPIGLRVFLSSTHVNSVLWSSDAGTEMFWNHNGDLSDSQWTLDSDSRHGGQALYIDLSNIPSGGDHIGWTIDLSGVNNLTVYEKTTNHRGTDFEIIVGGDTLFAEANNNFDYQGKTVDVSSYSGPTTVEIGVEDTDDNHSVFVSDIQLS